ncbi:hypothetical protein ACIA5D_50240 [Actinoplanes sp. NPDC051513]|uniref:MmyB family transcriptional regulator n=1 Tax=Actinoplanes sp. NPDC051513 TaxID=3363908 RepID=UPI00378B084D
MGSRTRSRSWPAFASRWETTPTTRVSFNWSASFRWRATVSASCGADTTCRAGRADRPGFSTPQVGELTVRREKLVVGGAKDQILVVYHAEPGTSSADKLSLLASLDRPPDRRTARRA